MRYNPSNKEAAQLLRGLRRDLDHALEEREPSGSVNLIRSASETAIASDSTTATEAAAESSYWGGDDWGFAEWGDYIQITDFEGDWRSGRWPTSTAWVESTDPAHVFSGSKGVVGTSTGTSNFISTGGLSYPSKGDIWRQPIRLVTDAYGTVIWGAQDTSNFYVLELRKDGFARVRRLVGGTYSLIGSNIAAGSKLANYSDQWIVPVISWRGNSGESIFDISLFAGSPQSTNLTPIMSFSRTDSTGAYSAGRIGYRITGGVDTTRVVAVDHPHIIERPGQTDPNA